MDEATWAALTATLTVIGLVWTYVSYRRRGGVAAMRAFGFTMFPVAAWLTGTMEMFTEIAASVTDWATGLVFNPVTWSGVGAAGFGVLLIFIAGVVRDRQLGKLRNTATPSTTSGPDRNPLPEARSTRAPGASAGSGLDDADADIEAMLKRRGIT